MPQEFLGDDCLNVLARHNDDPRNMSRPWVAMYEAGAFDVECQVSVLLQQDEAKIAVLEILVGPYVLEIEFLAGRRRTSTNRSTRTPVVAGLVVYPSTMPPDWPATPARFRDY